MTTSYRPQDSAGKFLRPLDALLSVRVGAAIKESLARVAEADGRTLSSLVQKLLKEFLELETALAKRSATRRPMRSQQHPPTRKDHHVQL